MSRETWAGRAECDGFLRPGNEVFLVFNQGWLQDERGGLNFRASRQSYQESFNIPFDSELILDLAEYYRDWFRAFLCNACN